MALEATQWVEDDHRPDVGRDVFATYLEMLAFNHKGMATDEAAAMARCEKAVEALRGELDEHPDFGPDAVDKLVAHQVERAQAVFAQELEGASISGMARAYLEQLRDIR
jgi:hypothetical protein